MELLELRAQQSLLREFGGRYPSVVEVASISDAHLMKLPGFGPPTIRRLRSIIQDMLTSSSTTARLSDAELLSEHGRIVAELVTMRDNFKRCERELKVQLRAVRIEIRVRGLALKREV
jgi:hypothetical protein